MAELSIIIVTFNTRQELDACLASIASHPPRVSCDIVVVDNASTDGTPDTIRSRWPAARLIDAGRNVGFAAANNLGIRAVASELVLLLNSDTMVPAGAIDTLVDELRSDPGLAAIGPRLVDAAGRTELSFGAMISPFNELRQKMLVALHRRRAPLVARFVERLTRRRGQPDWVSGACLLVRREDALRAGLLDERYFLYAEDVDFCAALRRIGKRIQFTPAAEVVHLRGASGRRRPAATERAYRASQLAFYDKHHPRWAGLLRAYLRVRGKLPHGAAS
ncbi:MAG: glycosyltransferase family 2 protein [Acidobacteria bacterium]|nr:glycosyltransferase family 2 protein [Acidobacteriota bacterium]